jgi:hypothetical protein
MNLLGGYNIGVSRSARPGTEYEEEGSEREEPDSTECSSEKRSIERDRLTLLAQGGIILAQFGVPVPQPKRKSKPKARANKPKAKSRQNKCAAAGESSESERSVDGSPLGATSTNHAVLGKLSFKNKSARIVHDIVNEPSFWWRLRAYTCIAAINETLFRWLRIPTVGVEDCNNVSTTRLDADMNEGARRVQLALQCQMDLGCIINAMCTDPAYRNQVVAPVRPALSRAGIPEGQFFVLLREFGLAYQAEWHNQFEDLSRPPYCLAVLAAPLFKAEPLLPFIMSNLSSAIDLQPSGSHMPRGNRRSCANSGCEQLLPLQTEAENKATARKFLEAYDAAIAAKDLLKDREVSDSILWKHHQVAKLFLDASEPAGQCLRKYASSAADFRLDCREMVPVLRLLDKYFITPCVSTQNIEGTHGVMTNILRRQPAIGTPLLSSRVCRVLNGVLERDKFLDCVKQQGFQSMREVNRESHNNTDESVAPILSLHRLDGNKHHFFWLESKQRQSFNPGEGHGPVTYDKAIDSRMKKITWRKLWRANIKIQTQETAQRAVIGCVLAKDGFFGVLPKESQPCKDGGVLLADFAEVFRALPCIDSGVPILPVCPQSGKVKDDLFCVLPFNDAFERITFAERNQWFYLGSKYECLKTPQDWQSLQKWRSTQKPVTCSEWWWRACLEKQTIVKPWQESRTYQKIVGKPEGEPVLPESDSSEHSGSEGSSDGAAAGGGRGGRGRGTGRGIGRGVGRGAGRGPTRGAGRGAGRGRCTRVRGGAEAGEANSGKRKRAVPEAAVEKRRDAYKEDLDPWVGEDSANGSDGCVSSEHELNDSDSHSESDNADRLGWGYESADDNGPGLATYVCEGMLLDGTVITQDFDVHQCPVVSVRKPGVSEPMYYREKDVIIFQNENPMQGTVEEWYAVIWTFFRVVEAPTRTKSGKREKLTTRFAARVLLLREAHNAEKELKWTPPARGAWDTADTAISDTHMDLVLDWSTDRASEDMPEGTTDVEIGQILRKIPVFKKVEYAVKYNKKDFSNQDARCVRFAVKSDDDTSEDLTFQSRRRVMGPAKGALGKRYLVFWRDFFHYVRAGLNPATFLEHKIERNADDYESTQIEEEQPVVAGDGVDNCEKQKKGGGRHKKS